MTVQQVVTPPTAPADRPVSGKKASMTLLSRALGSLDRQLGRFTMYRLVTVTLSALAVMAIVMAAVGWLETAIFQVGPMLLTIAVLIGSTAVASLAFGAVFRHRPQLESSVITGLILWFLYWPTSDPKQLAWLAAAGAFAGASKYLLAIRGRHLFNPAAAGVVLLLLVGTVTGGTGVPFTTWWAANSAMTIPVLIGALLVLYRTRKLVMAGIFVVLAAVFSFWGVASFYPTTGAAIDYVVNSTPIVFFVGFMLCEPLTLAPRTKQQYALAATMAVFFTWGLLTTKLFGTALVIHPFESTTEIGLLIVNAIAFVLGQRGRIELQHTATRSVGGDITEWSFQPRRPVRFQPGQYVELSIPHKADSRGIRRVFSISSPTSDGQVTIAARVPSPGSSFKAELAKMVPGQQISATTVAGDFTWPRQARKPLLLVAGGIGMTPFMSQLRSYSRRDVRMVLGVQNASDVPYRAELEQTGVPVVLVGPGDPGVLPDSWQHVDSPLLTADVVAGTVPDLARRKVMLSGPPVMVSALRSGLSRKCAGVHTDAFLGY